MNLIYLHLFGFISAHIIFCFMVDRFTVLFLLLSCCLFGQVCLGLFLISTPIPTISLPDECLFGALPPVKLFVVSTSSVGSIFRPGLCKSCICFCQVPRDFPARGPLFCQFLSLGIPTSKGWCTFGGLVFVLLLLKTLHSFIFQFYFIILFFMVAFFLSWASLPYS